MLSYYKIRYEIPQLFTHVGRENADKDGTGAIFKNIKTEFVAVRFVNVLGSNGSVIPLFKKQIEEGAPAKKLYEKKWMAEEGLRKTENDLIHIGRPILFETDDFPQQLGSLMAAAYGNKKSIGEKVAAMVCTYHPDNAPSTTEKIINKLPWLAGGSITRKKSKQAVKKSQNANKKLASHMRRQPSYRFFTKIGGDVKRFLLVLAKRYSFRYRQRQVFVKSVTNISPNKKP